MKIAIGWICLFWITACRVNPKPIQVGDLCAHCKMPIADVKFAGELVTTKGKIYTFDDMACVKQFSAYLQQQNIDLKMVLAVDHAHAPNLIAVQDAFLLRSESLPSPMNGGIAVFSSLADAERVKLEFPGEIIRWETYVKGAIK
jgi:copper chaperone NosL